MERGKGFEFVNEVFGGTIPGQFIPAVEKGVRDLAGAGGDRGIPAAGYSRLRDGRQASSGRQQGSRLPNRGEICVQGCGALARPVLLEPIVKMEVTVPEDKMGTITGDLAGKRGRIQGTDILPGGVALIQAEAPLSEVMQYQSQLKSVTGGQGSFVMELSHYEWLRRR